MQRQRFPASVRLISARSGLGVVGQQRRGAHQETGGAETALHRPVVDEGPLQRREFPADRETFDRADVAAFGGDGESETGKDGLTIEDHRTGPTCAEVAAPLGAGEEGLLPQGFEKRGVGRRHHFVGVAVYLQA